LQFIQKEGGNISSLFPFMMSLFHVTGAYMDFSGPLDAANPPGRAYGCQFEVGGGFVPAGADPLHPVPHAVCYPLEGSALYLLTAAQGPVQKRYVLRHFILGYPSGAVVVGWYHDRLCDMLPSSMSVNDIEILSSDTKINMSRPALCAKTPEGRFITGPLWLGAFNPHDQKHLGPQWNQTPSFVLHGSGWYVPSWAFEPEGRAGIRTHKPQMMPRGSVQQDKQKPPAERVSPKTEPRSSLFQNKEAKDGKECLKQTKEYWSGLSTGGLVRSADQSDPNMPTYYDIRSMGGGQKNF